METEVDTIHPKKNEALEKFLNKRRKTQMDAKEIIEKLKAQWRPKQKGECLYLKPGYNNAEDCECHICLLNKLAKLLDIK